MTELVHLQVESGVAEITLDSVPNRNALSAQLMTELAAHLHAAASNSLVRSVVLKHTSSTFCSGADLSGSSGPGADMAQLVVLLRDFLECPKPIVACIDGHVRGGGLGLVAACDIAVASPASSFALSEVRLGVAAAIISLTVLPRLSSRGASKYFLTGDRFAAEDAERIGLITASEEFPLGAIEKFTDSFRASSPAALASTKRLLSGPVLLAFDAQQEAMSELSAQLFGGEEAKEGIAAFKERRTPTWAEL
ncbi:MAG: enoyl-CoA hydratase family protein [Microthrixaceae bacterium]